MAKRPPMRAVISCGQLIMIRMLEDSLMARIEEMEKRMANFIKLAKATEKAGVFLNKYAVEAKSRLDKMMYGINIAMGTGSSPRSSAMEEGKMETKNEFISPTFQAEMKMMALTIAPVSHWFCGV